VPDGLASGLNADGDIQTVPLTCRSVESIRHA
jgi:hypothetical protein